MGGTDTRKAGRIVSANTRTVVIGCAHSAGMARDTLYKAGQHLPPDVEWLDVQCGGSVDEILLLRAFEDGADRVMVLVCNDGACQSLEGNRRAERRVQATKSLLEEIGIAPWRLELHNIGPNQPADLVAWVDAFRAATPPEEESVSEPAGA